MDKWCEPMSARSSVFLLEKELQPQILDFFQKEIYWDSANSQDLIKNLSKNIFSFSMIEKMEKHYIGFILNYLKEKNISLASLNLTEHFNDEFKSEPAKMLFHADGMLLATVKEAVFFIEDAIGKEGLAQKLLISDYYTLASTIFADKMVENQYLEKLEQAKQVFRREWSEMVKMRNHLQNINNNPYPLELSINTVKLLNTYLLRDCLPNNLKLILALVRQGIVRPDHLVHYDNHSKPLFEYYLYRPTQSRKEIMIEMMRCYPDIFDWKKLSIILQSENLPHLKDFPEQEINFNDLRNIIKKNSLYYQLRDSLLPEDKQKESEGDDIQKI
jgi:hypothetical protein